MAVTVSVGHKVNMSLVFLDQNGNPMLTPPAPDSPPVWTDTTAATETIAPAADGLSCVGTAIATGGDTVSVTAVVAGASFAASLAVTVSPVAQVLTSIQIAATIS